MNELTNKVRDVAPRAPGTAPMPEFPGLDTEGALRVWRDKQRYRTVLKSFQADYTAQFAALNSSDAQAQRAMIHRLAGAAGSLGLSDVSQAAKAFGHAVQIGADPTPDRAALLDQIRIAWASISRYLGEQGADLPDARSGEHHSANRPAGRYP